MLTAAVASVAVGACGLAGLAAPHVVRRLAEPVDAPGDRPADEPAPPTYAEVASRRWLTPACVAGGLLAAALVCWRVEPGWAWAVWLPVVPVLVLLAAVDACTRLLPSRLVLPATALALAVTLLELALVDDRSAPVRALIGLLAVRTAFWALWWLHSAGLGFGDVRLGALLGLLLGHLGLAELFVGSYAAFVLFAVPGLLWAIVKRDRSVLKRAYPFGPFLVLGAFVGVGLGPFWG